MRLPVTKNNASISWRTGLSGIRPAVIAAALVSAVGLGAALYRVPELLRIDRAALASPSLSLQDADVQGLSEYNLISSSDLESLAQAIPLDATYSVIVGHDPPEPGNDATAVRPIVVFWLLPRRYTSRIHDVGWVIAYNIAPAATGVHYVGLTSLGPGLNLLRVK